MPQSRRRRPPPRRRARRRRDGRRRLLALLILSVLAFSAISGRLIVLQVLDAGSLDQAAARQRLHTIELPATRHSAGHLVAAFVSEKGRAHFAPLSLSVVEGDLTNQGAVESCRMSSQTGVQSPAAPMRRRC